MHRCSKHTKFIVLPNGGCKRQCQKCGRVLYYQPGTLNQPKGIGD